MKRLIDWWYQLPAPARSAIVDAAESGAAAALAVQVVIPAAIGGWTQIAVTIATAFVGAFVSSLRRWAQAAIAHRQAIA